MRESAPMSEELDGTWSTYPEQARDWEAIRSSADYEERWQATPAYERWSLSLPSAFEALPPEDVRQHRVHDGSGRGFEPARMFGQYAPAADDDSMALSHPMWTAIGRLWGCLVADGHPDAAQAVVHQTPDGPRGFLATPEDLRKLARMALVAAAEVIDEGWTDQICPQHSDLTEYDRTLPARCATLAAWSDEQIYDAGYVLHPAVAAVFDREARTATAEETPETNGPAARDTAAAVVAADLGPFRASALLRGQVGRHVQALPDVRGELDATWNALYAAAKAGRQDPYPRVAGVAGTDGFWFEPGSPADARALLTVTRQVAADYLAEDLRAERDGEPFLDRVERSHLFALLRELAQGEVGDEDALASLAGATPHYRGPAPFEGKRVTAFVGLDDEEAQAWRALDPYERWHLPLPGVHAVHPPESPHCHQLFEDSAMGFTPARFLGRYGPDTPASMRGSGRRAISHRMWTAIGRLFGCLVADDHPDAPQVVVRTVPNGQVAYFATSADVRKLSRLTKVAATMVLDGWIDPLRPDLDALEEADAYVPQGCEAILSWSDEHVYDFGWALHPAVAAVEDAETRDADRLASVVFDQEAGTVTDTARGVTPGVADVVAAAQLQGLTHLIADPSSPFGQATRFGAYSPGGWAASFAHGQDRPYALATFDGFGDFTPSQILSGPLRDALDRLPVLAGMLDTAWKWLYMYRIEPDGADVPWPAFRKTVSTDGASGVQHWFEPATTEDARAVLVLTRDVAAHLYAAGRRAERAGVPSPLPFDDHYALRGLLRVLDHVENPAVIDDVQVARWIDPCSFIRDGEGPAGPITQEGRPLTTVRDATPPAPGRSS